MKKENLLLWTLPIVMVFVGLFAGFYFGIYRASVAVVGCELSKATIAPSPVVTKSVYDEKNHRLQLTVRNTGAMPILLVDKTLVLRPANGSKNVVVMTSIPLGLAVPAYSDISFTLDLGAAGSGFVVGDVLETTLTYTLPVSNDIYALVHLFKKSNKTNAQGLVENQLGNNQTKLENYNKQVKENAKKVNSQKANK